MRRGNWMRTIGALMGVAMLAIVGCGSGAGTNRSNDRAQADAARERPIPCSVQAHGMGAVIGAAAGKPDAAPCDNSVDPQRVALDELIRIIPDQHPSFYYVLASRLLAAGRKDEAVF